MRLLCLRPRLRLRTLLIAVAVIGVTIGGWQMWKRRKYCLEWADRHSSDARSYRLLSDRVSETRAYAAAFRAAYLEEAAREARIAARYRHVARYPWLPLPREPE